ncbi:hypothetical protein GCM10023215_08540 [Pseudonocardia yuanmonensis]|uniref:FXSXX-COOH protein n=1 Tax=Pseudonocardia yuanmonensis TaxID=1095914 RepID=A0ABP8W1I0_9PSEU
MPTVRGLDLIAVAQQLVPELERQVAALIGADRVDALREDLEAIRSAGPAPD